MLGVSTSSVTCIYMYSNLDRRCLVNQQKDVLTIGYFRTIRDKKNCINACLLPEYREHNN